MLKQATCHKVMIYVTMILNLILQRLTSVWFQILLTLFEVLKVYFEVNNMLVPISDSFWLVGINDANHTKVIALFFLPFFLRWKDATCKVDLISGAQVQIFSGIDQRDFLSCAAVVCTFSCEVQLKVILRLMDRIASYFLSLRFW